MSTLTQTHSHTNTKAHSHMSTLTQTRHIHTQTQTHTHKHIQTHKHIHTQTDKFFYVFVLLKQKKTKPEICRCTWETRPCRRSRPKTLCPKDNEVISQFNLIHLLQLSSTILLKYLLIESLSMTKAVYTIIWLFKQSVE